MGYRTLDQIIIYDRLQDGQDPTYELEPPQDIWYLGLAGELASEIKCSKITLPMLSRDQYDWKIELEKALVQAVSLRPHKHVDSFNHASSEFSKELENVGLSENAQGIHCWLSNSETKKSLQSQVEYSDHYPFGHYTVDRRGIALNISPKTIALTPHPDYFGSLLINEKFFNFILLPKNMFVYYLKNLKISDDA